MAICIVKPELKQSVDSKVGLIGQSMNQGMLLEEQTHNLSPLGESTTRGLFSVPPASAVQKLAELEYSLPGESIQGIEALGGFVWSSARETNEIRFTELARQWQDETATSSSITEMAMHPAYQQIVGMGRDALPFILRELEKAPHHWFWALRAITRENPVSPDHRGDLEAMTRDWLEWAVEETFLPSE